MFTKKYTYDDPTGAGKGGEDIIAADTFRESIQDLTSS